MALIELEGVGKSFTTQRGRSLLVGRGGIGDWIRGKKTSTFDALHEIAFKVERGESVGIIGANGSGKSTLLKILAGVTAPTRGSVVVNGKVASLLELGAGFHPLLTGRENVYLNGRILGMHPSSVDRVFDRIVDFSGIGPFIDNPVETYSSGMFVRLGFSVAVFANPDIFLVDEVLAVGDEEFQRKCRQKIIELRDQGKTIVFVSHDLGLVNALCNQVVLLSRGQMITRGTPQKTIDYYLRQTGSPQGIHTLSSGRADAIFAHGRLTLFRDQTELSGPHGLSAEIYSMERLHPAQDADWRVIERGASHCVAHGRTVRLPLTHVWEMRIEDDRLIWDIAVDCDRPIPVTVFNANLAFPVLYREWLYGELAGQFPDILPSDLAWSLVASQTIPCREAALLPPDTTSYPPIDVRLQTPLPYVRLLWFNSDYLAGTRMLQANALLPTHDAQFPAGHSHLMTLEIDLGATPASLRDRIQAERSMVIGSCTVRFDGGAVRIRHQETEVTAGAHVYASLLIGHLWNDSMRLQWGSVTPVENGFDISGMSRRFPYRQRWEVRTAPMGIHLRIWLEALEPIDTQEYQVSAMVRPEYDRWETEHESGEFPAIALGQEDWVHLNRSYMPGSRITARGPLQPRVTLFSDSGGQVPRMTAINTSHVENTRVLQALHTPARSTFHFDTGEHLLFSGGIEVEG